MPAHTASRAAIVGGCLTTFDSVLCPLCGCCSVGRCCQHHPSSRQSSSCTRCSATRFNTPCGKSWCRATSPSWSESPRLATRSAKGCPSTRYERSWTLQRIAGQLHVQDAKTEDSEAVLPLSEVACAHSPRTPGTTAGRASRPRRGVGGPRSRVSLGAGHSDGADQPQPLFRPTPETAGLPGVRLHDLRHAVVSLLMELGVPPHVVQAIARHADVKITLKVYAHANLDAMRQALGKLHGKLS
ncbi:tyrosine-type recombinase/integrase [Micromonospora zamorensis]|uniref:tyrosine-type recombinase/integrase n=1 Tax=Micromonospora zamorensis TaxID=709883 RepID=UPI001E462D1E|nr:tyrosine-type recombinase/integrase [Micromonospora zamorensis]